MDEPPKDFATQFREIIASENRFNYHGPRKDGYKLPGDVYQLMQDITRLEDVARVVGQLYATDTDGLPHISELKLLVNIVTSKLRKELQEYLK